MTELSLNHIGHQQLSVAGSAVALTIAPVGATPRHALIFVGTDSVRWRADGTAPTATVGILVPANSYIDWTDPLGDFWGLIKNVQFIRTNTSATLDIAYMT